MKSDLKQIKKEFFKIQNQVAVYAEKLDEKFEKLGILIEKIEKENNEEVRRPD